MRAESHSSSDLLAALLRGAVRKGVPLSRHEVKFGDYVVAITAPGAPRMPNGIEARLDLAPGAHVAIGRGVLVVGRVTLAPGAPWNPVPALGAIERLPAGPEPLTSATAALAMDPELAHEGLVAGYVAGLALLHGQRRRAEVIARRAMEHADAFAVTLLRHAARGEVPEPVHDLLLRDDARSLMSWSPVGMLWLRGLVSAGLSLELTTASAASGPQTHALYRR